MMISKTLKTLEDKDHFIDLSLVKKLLEIFSVLLVIFTILYFTCFGCFLVLNGSTSWIAQKVTLSGEGAASESYPDSMGEYEIVEVTKDTEYNWYRHVGKKNRSLVYIDFGNI